MLRAESSPGGLLLQLEGAWQAPAAASAESALRTVVLPAVGTVTLESLAEGPLAAGYPECEAVVPAQLSPLAACPLCQ